MPERFREKFLRNLMPYDAAFRAFARVYASLGKGIALPTYRAPGWQPEAPPKKMQENPIFITGRFRTGSTLLWQCFIRLKCFTAYYEPFNERQWFDPVKRGKFVDASHRGVDDYSSNYDGLKDIGHYFDINWTVRRIAMGSHDANDNMVRYVARLIEAAAHRPVLQFNRVDFRTGFLKANFPDAVLVHVTRDARDTWLSTLRGEANDSAWNLLTYQPFCHFYLLHWYRDLALSFPQLVRPAQKTHPYEIHYLIHRLSTLFAARDCDVFISYEDMEHDLPEAIKALMAKIGAPDNGIDVLEGLLSPRKQRYDHSPDLEFYQHIENRVEAELQSWLGADG